MQKLPDFAEIKFEVLEQARHTASASIPSAALFSPAMLIMHLRAFSTHMEMWVTRHYHDNANNDTDEDHNDHNDHA